MRDLFALFPAVVDAPAEPGIVDADGTILCWADVAAAVHARAAALVPSRAVLLHGSTSRALAIEIWAAQLAGIVPVLVHPRVPAERAREQFARVERALANAPPARSDDDTAAATVVFTSGSTRAPRGVVLSFAALRDSARAANAHLAFAPGHRWLLSLPLVHVGGLGILERARVSGGALVIPPADMTLKDAVPSRAVTHLSLVTAQLLDAVEQRVETSESLKAVLIGGGPVAPALLLRAAGLPLAQTWGMTETCAQVATSALYSPSTCGPPLAGREVRVSSSGELLVRGIGLASAYIDDDALCTLPKDEDGFFHTRDSGALTPEGHVIVHGRMDTVFISGGENIQPELIERALLEHAGVRRALVVPVPHPRYGARPVAFVMRDARAPIDDDGLRRHLAARVARHELPDAFLPWPHDAGASKPARPEFTARALALLAP